MGYEIQKTNDDVLRSANNQIAAASVSVASIEWEIRTDQSADRVRALFEEEGITGIRVVVVL